MLQKLHTFSKLETFTLGWYRQANVVSCRMYYNNMQGREVAIVAPQKG